MANLNDDIGATRAHFEWIFDVIAHAMTMAVREKDHSIASSVAERYGLTETSPAKPIGAAWQTTMHGMTVWFQWRYYDQSKPFSNRKDMNILSLEFRDHEKIVRKAEERFED